MITTCTCITGIVIAFYLVQCRHRVLGPAIHCDAHPIDYIKIAILRNEKIAEDGRQILLMALFLLEPSRRKLGNQLSLSPRSLPKLSFLTAGEGVILMLLHQLCTRATVLFPSGV